MEPSAEEAAAKCVKPSSAGMDRLSALPDDVLVLILLRLLTPEAVRTSVLSRRWRRVWGLLPELCFSFAEPHGIRNALAASAVPLRYLLVGGLRGESAATWLLAAARRLAGKLALINMGRAGGQSEEGGAIELPCFDKATSISLDLGLLALSVPPAGVFARLTELSLTRVRFHRPCELGGAVSSPRCPCLQKFTVKNSRGLDNLAINSDSLKLVELIELRDLQQLTILVPVLQELIVVSCFSCDQTRQPVANISVPQLESLWWADAYDPSSVHLGKMENLKSLSTIFFVYGPEGFPENLSCLMLMSRVKVIESLTLGLAYPQVSSLQLLFRIVIVRIMFDLNAHIS